MTRDEAIRQCGAYLDGQLNPAEERELEEFLRKDADTAHYFAEQKCFQRLLKKCSQRQAPPADFEARLKEKLDCCPCARAGLGLKLALIVAAISALAVLVYWVVKS
jgi:anti-sigma factor RsiW